MRQPPGLDAGASLGHNRVLPRDTRGHLSCKPVDFYSSAIPRMAATRISSDMPSETVPIDAIAALTNESLQEDLAAIRSQRLTGAAAAAYEEVLLRFDQGEMLENAIKPGDPMPPFLLPNTAGQLVDSATLLSRGPLIVTFYRGGWCPYCMATLEALERLRASFECLGASLVALSPDTGGRGAQIRRRHNLQFEILTDVDSTVAFQFGVMIRLPARYRQLMSSKSVEARDWHGNPSWFIPLPSTFVVASNGAIVHTEVHVDFTNRTEPLSLPRVLSDLRVNQREGI
jgi:peroxiredoxin